jgi:hypothetical protein
MPQVSSVHITPQEDEVEYVALLGGSSLCSSGTLRFTYVDESGISEHEPFVVVAGVLIDGDNVLAPVEDHLEALMHEHIPETDWDKFYFHAKDIWQGTGYFRGRDVWPRERRMRLLRELAWIPGRFNLPIVFGFQEKANIARRVPQFSTVTPHERSILCHAYGFLGMALNLERFMRAELPDEVTFLTVEDRADVRQILKKLQALLKRRGADVAFVESADALPLRKIRDTPHFAGKRECQLLQLADACAFIINGHLRRASGNNEFYDALWPTMVYHPKGEIWPVLQWPLGPLFRFWEGEYWQQRDAS